MRTVRTSYIFFFQIVYFYVGLFKLGIPEETLEGQIVASGVIPADDIPGIMKFVQTCLTTVDPANKSSLDDLFRNEWVEPGFEG
jgi:hypothetical protein